MSSPIETVGGHKHNRSAKHGKEEAEIQERGWEIRTS
jgi:hypothetical protein